MSGREEVLEIIREEDSVIRKKYETLESIKKRLENIKKEYNLKFDVFLGGSMAKGTDIKGSDLDIFLLFPENFNPLEILKFLKREFVEGKEEYSEHPYLILDYDRFSVDIVPAYKMDPGNPLVTSVDRTPLHVEFVKNNFSENMKDESRILKQFLKGIGIYGAESSVQGFSGYVSELLIYQYGSFDNVIANVSKWKIPYAVTGKVDDFKDANLVILDPVDSARNAGANVSKENLATFILASKTFSWENYKNFFFPETYSFDMPKYGYAISIPCKRCNDEILIPNLRRASAIIKSELESLGFRVLYSSIFLLDKGYIVLIPENVEVNNCVIHSGPPVTNGNLMDFLQKWGDGTKFGPPFIVGDRLFVIRERDTTKFSDAVNSIIKKIRFANDFIVDNIKILPLNHSDIPKKIKEGFVKPHIGRWTSGNIK